MELTITAARGAVGGLMDAQLVPQPNAASPAPIEVVTVGGVVGSVMASDHDDVALLMRMGIPLSVTVAPGAVHPVVSVSLAVEPDLES